MPVIHFRGAVIRYADLRHDEEAGKFVRLHFSADWTESVRDDLGWSEIPDCVRGGKLTGDLAATSLILTPPGRELAAHELQIECSEVSDFALVRIQTEDDTTREELRFIARSRQADAAARVEAYLGAIGAGAGTLKVRVSKQQQMELGETEPSEDETEPEDSETDEPETETDAPLASMREMGASIAHTLPQLLEIGRIAAGQPVVIPFEANGHVKASLDIIETATGWAGQARCRFAREQDVTTLDGGDGHPAEYAAKGAAAEALFRHAQSVYAQAHGQQKKAARELSNWAATHMSRPTVEAVQ